LTVPLRTASEGLASTYLGADSMRGPDTPVEVVVVLAEEPHPASAIRAQQDPASASARRGARPVIGSVLMAGTFAQPPRARKRNTYTHRLHMTRHLLTGGELQAAELSALLERAAELKRAPLSSHALTGSSVALIFQRPSTRTRVSFEVGVDELGGHALVLRPDEMQLSRGEAMRDTALVLSRHVRAIGLRTGEESALAELARYSSVPVFNMLSPRHHPCQALADLLTVREACGELAGLRVAYVGDGNNVARSLAIVGALAGVQVAIAAPAGPAPRPSEDHAHRLNDRARRRPKSLSRDAEPLLRFAVSWSALAESGIAVPR